MKIVIVSPPKSGAQCLRCLVATAYGLRAVDARDAPTTCDPGDILNWLQALPENCVTHTNLPFDPALTDASSDHGATFITIVRHPFDLFVTEREVLINRKQRANRRSRMDVDPIDERSPRPDVDRQDPLIAFAGALKSLLDWTRGATVVLRYEDILERPESTLAAVSRHIGPLDLDQIAHAVKLCPSEQRIFSGGNRGARMAEIAPGSWRTDIDPATLNELQRRFALSVVDLGYEPTLAS